MTDLDLFSISSLSFIKILLHLTVLKLNLFILSLELLDLTLNLVIIRLQRFKGGQEISVLFYDFVVGNENVFDFDPVLLTEPPSLDLTEFVKFLL